MSVREFVTENPEADYRAITARFGTPEQIAQSCIAQMEPDELLAGMQLRKKLMLVALCTALVLAIIEFGFELSIYLHYGEVLNGYAVVEVIELEEIPLEEEEN